MCKEVEKVIEENAGVTPTCTVIMDGVERTSDDFVCVLSKDNGDASLLYNTDAVTLGMAMRMITRALVDTLSKVPEEERESVEEILRDILMPGSSQEEATDE